MTHDSDHSRLQKRGAHAGTCTEDPPASTPSPAKPLRQTDIAEVGLTPRSASATRVLALRLQRSPFPDLSKKQIGSRWKAGPDSVRKILRRNGVDPGPEKHRLVPLTDVLLCEGFRDPLVAWISATDDDRTILCGDLLSLDEWRTLVCDETTRDRTKYYRELTGRTVSSIRIGKLHRFRPTLELCRGVSGSAGAASP